MIWRFVLAVVLLLVSMTSAYAQSTDESLEAGFAALQKNDADRAATSSVNP